MTVSNEQLVDMYETMLLIRRFEEVVGEMYLNNQIAGFLHTYVGEEAVAVGACNSIRKDDFVTSTHRGHGHLIAKGGDINLMMAELFGRKTGYCKGKGGSMHIADVNLGILGANGIVGAGLPIATGAALASKRLYGDRVCVCFFGDGASNRGTFHESLNLASVWDLPIVFVCENNQFGMTVARERTMKIEDVALRAKSYDMRFDIVDGMSVEAVYEAVRAAVMRARSGKGPSLVECKTYRFVGHWVGDPGSYRSEEEVKEWKKKDPIENLGAKLLFSGAVSDDDLKTIAAEVDARVEESVAYAENSPYPEREQVLEGVYAGTPEVMGR